MGPGSHKPICLETFFLFDSVEHYGCFTIRISDIFDFVGYLFVLWPIQAPHEKPTFFSAHKLNINSLDDTVKYI